MSLALWPQLYGPYAGPRFDAFQHFQTAAFSTRAGYASTAWSAADRAIYIPIRIGEPTLMVFAYWHNGATPSGNINVGLYSEDGTRLISTGAVAQSGVFAGQTVDITDTMVGPGIYYVGMAMDSTSGTFYGVDYGTVPNWAKLLGVHTQDGLTHSPITLPAVATFATAAVGHVPHVGFASRVVV